MMSSWQRQEKNEELFDSVEIALHNLHKNVLKYILRLMTKKTSASIGV